jgi:hypothetical protein
MQDNNPKAEAARRNGRLSRKHGLTAQQKNLPFSPSNKLARAEYLQVSLLDLEIDINSEKITQAFQTIEPSGLLAIGLKSLDDHIDRHLVRLSRERARVAALLQQAVAGKKRKQVKLQNEPIETAALTSDRED